MSSVKSLRSPLSWRWVFMTLVERDFFFALEWAGAYTGTARAPVNQCMQLTAAPSSSFPPLALLLVQLNNGDVPSCYTTGNTATDRFVDISLFQPLSSLHWHSSSSSQTLTNIHTCTINRHWNTLHLHKLTFVHIKIIFWIIIKQYFFLISLTFRDACHLLF